MALQQGDMPHSVHELIPIVQLLLFIVAAAVRLPRVAAKLHAAGVHPSMWATQWFMTVFAYSFPLHAVARIWDSFLLEGWKVPLRVALALLADAERELTTVLADDPGNAKAVRERGLVIDLPEAPPFGAAPLDLCVVGYSSGRLALVDLSACAQGRAPVLKTCEGLHRAPVSAVSSRPSKMMKHRSKPFVSPSSEPSTMNSA